MSEVDCKRVMTLEELIVCTRVRDQGFREEGLLTHVYPMTHHEVDSFDMRSETVNLLVTVGEEPAAVVRLIPESKEVAQANGYSRGVALEQRCRIDRGPGPETKIGEISRITVLKKWRHDKRVHHALATGLYAESRKLGLTHWVSLSNTHTDCYEDAKLVYEIALRRGLVSPDWVIQPRVLSAPEQPPHKTLYTPEQRQRAVAGGHARLHLPPTLRFVIKRANGLIAGGPIYEPYFLRYGLPVVMRLAVLESLLSTDAAPSPRVPRAKQARSSHIVAAPGTSSLWALIDALNQELQKLLAALDANPIARRLYEGTVSKAEYVDFLIQSFHYVIHTETLLARAAEQLLRLGQHPDIAHFFAQKATEERGHAEWIILDLKAMGIPREVVEQTPPSSAVKAYVAWNTMIVESDCPVAFTATGHVLEALSTYRAGEAAKNLVKNSGIPHISEATSFLAAHGELDQAHSGENAQVLQQVTDPREQDLLLLTAAATRVAYLNLFRHSPQSPIGGLAALVQRGR
jgi:pyrroloquinoline quinone (PQQ) biosynthesis protein C